MDPKTLASLDPKLRETYERVMGTSAAVGPAQPAMSDTPAVPFPAPPSPAITTPAVEQAPAGQLLSSSAPDAPPIPSPAGAYTPESLGLAQPAVPPAPQPGQTWPQESQEIAPAPAAKSSPALIRILYILGGIIFFIAYTYFWIKIFKLPLPF